VAWTPITPACLCILFPSFFPTQADCCGCFWLLLLPSVDCCFISPSCLHNAILCFLTLSLLMQCHDATLWKFLFILSRHHSLESFLKSHANLTMPLSGYWKLWLPVGTKIECAALCCTQCKHCSRKNNNPLIPSFQKLGIMAASQISSCMQCKHHHRKRQQSNCTAGGNPKFLEIGNHGCQLDF